MKAIIVLAALVALGSASFTPVANFNFSSLYLCELDHSCRGFFVNSVYSSTGDFWRYQQCATVTYQNATASGNNITNQTNQYNALINAYEVGHVNLFFDPKNQAVVYSDQALTQVAFVVMNYTSYNNSNNRTQIDIVVGKNESGAITILGLRSEMDFPNAPLDISKYLSGKGYTPVVGGNYFFVNHQCGPILPSSAYPVFKKQSKILGDWNILGVYDPKNFYSWKDATCPAFQFEGVPHNLYNMSLHIKISGDQKTYGPWSLVGDSTNNVMFYGYYFGYPNDVETLLEVSYMDLLENSVFTSTYGCTGFFVSKRRTKISNAEKKLFEGLMNTQAKADCPSLYNANDFYYPAHKSCKKEDDLFLAKF